MFCVNLNQCGPLNGSVGDFYAILEQTLYLLQMGQLRTDNPEEEKKQKAIKGLLNKITPDKFEKILGDLVMVGYESEETESGLIAQVGFACGCLPLLAWQATRAAALRAATMKRHSSGPVSYQNRAVDGRTWVT